MTHPFHPLAGREFEVVEHRRKWDENCLYFVDDEKRLRQLPAAWTDYIASDPFVEIARGQSVLHPVCLVRLVALVGDWLVRGSEEKRQGNDAGYVK